MDFGTDNNEFTLLVGHLGLEAQERALKNGQAFIDNYLPGAKTEEPDGETGRRGKTLLVHRSRW